jgi:hypothetical protein
VTVDEVEVIRYVGREARLDMEASG